METEEKGMQGHPGTQGFHTHMDYPGNNGPMGWSSTAPECLIKLIQFRNDQYKKEWGSYFIHDVKTEDGTYDEHQEKVRFAQNKVKEQHQKTELKFQEFDRLINEISKFVDPK